MAYEKQTWDTDTTSYVNPTRMNHIEEGIESATEGNPTYTDYTVTTDTNGYANLSSANLNTINAMVLSPQRAGCDLWLNSVGSTNYRAYIYARGAYNSPLTETECVIRVWSV